MAVDRLLYLFGGLRGPVALALLLSAAAVWVWGRPAAWGWPFAVAVTQLGLLRLVMLPRVWVPAGYEFLLHQPVGLRAVAAGLSLGHLLALLMAAWLALLPALPVLGPAAAAPPAALVYVYSLLSLFSSLSLLARQRLAAAPAWGRAAAYCGYLAVGL